MQPDRAVGRRAQQEPAEAELRWNTWLDLAQARDENPRGVTAQQVGRARERWEEAAAAEQADREAEAG